MVEVPEGLIRDRVREDGAKLDIIFQFLHSRGLLKTAAQLEAETERAWGHGEQSLDELFDKALVQDLPSVSSQCRNREAGVCVTAISNAGECMHGNTNPTCVVWHPTDPVRLLTGGVDKRIALVDVDTMQELCSAQVPSPPLAIDWSVSGDVAVACMGGELVWLSKDLECLAVSAKAHSNNRVNMVRFSPSGALVASCGKDSFVHIWHKTTNTYEMAASIRCGREIACFAWLSEETVCLAETGNCMLQVHAIDSEGKSTKLDGEICMNLSLADPRTDYTALAMCVDRTGQYLAVSTSRNSALLFSLSENEIRTSACTPIKVFYGMSVGIYDVPAIAFSLDGSFVYITSDKEILVFECNTGFKAFTIEVSKSRPVRGMAHHCLFDQLAAVSFDKQLSIVK